MVADQHGRAGAPRGVEAAAAVGQHDGRAAGRGGGADGVDDGAHALALVEVGAGAVDEGAAAGVGDRAPSASCRCARRPQPWRSRGRRRCRSWPASRRCRSPVWPHPEPRTRATSWRSAPVRSAITAAAAWATSNGSVAGSDRSGTPGDGLLCSVTPEDYPCAVPVAHRCGRSPVLRRVVPVWSWRGPTRLLMGRALTCELDVDLYFLY